MIGGDFTGIADQSGLVSVFSNIRPIAPLQPTPDHAAIELGAVDPRSVEDTLNDIVSSSTVTKAQLADVAMNAISDYLASGFVALPPYRLPGGQPVVDRGGIVHDVTIDDGTILSGGAAGIRTTGTSGLFLLLENGGTIASLAEDAPAVDVDDNGALIARLDDGAILTFFDGAAGIDAQGREVAADIRMSGDSRIHTAGDNAPAIAAPGATAYSTSSSMAEPRKTACRPSPPSATTPRGISVAGDGLSTVTMQIAGATSDLGPGLQTSGANSTLIDVDLGSQSSITFGVENSSFGTYGDGSGVISLGIGDLSDVLVYLNDVELSSWGADATLLDIARSGDTATEDLVVFDSRFASEGDGAAGIVFRSTGGGSAETIFLSDSTVETGGADATAFLIEGRGNNSSRTVWAFSNSFRTAGDNSDGVLIEGLGDNSAIEVTLEDLTVATEGDRSRGMVLETGLTNSTGSVSTTRVDGVDIVTTGAEAHGLVLGAGVGTDDPGANTTNSLRVEDLNVATSGAGAHALVIGEGATVTIQPPWLGGPLSDGTSVNGLFDSFDGLSATGPGAYSILNRGTLAGGFSLGGSLGMDGGLLELSVLGSSTFDQVLLSGSFDVLNPFDLFLDFGSFVPQAGDLYELVVASSQATTFDPLDAISLSFGGISPTDGLFDLRFNDGVLALSVNGQAPPPDIAPIPVPAALPMLLSALGFVAVLKRRRRHAA
jgi:hypothetical protein